MRRVLLVLTVLTAACKDHADTSRTSAQACERVYRICPSAIPASETDNTVCADVFTDRCGAEMRQYVQCATSKCDDAGAIDRVAIERACFGSIEAYRECNARDGGPVGPDQGQLPPFPTDAGTEQ